MRRIAAQYWILVLALAMLVGGIDLAWGQGAGETLVIDEGGEAWWSVALALLALGVVEVWKAFRGSPLYERLGTKQRLVARIVALAVQAAWHWYEGSKKKASRADGKLTVQDRAQLMGKAKGVARKMGREMGLENMPELQDDLLLEGAIEAAVTEAKALAGQAPKAQAAAARAGGREVWSKGRPREI